MIYELQIRGTNGKQMSSDNLIWIDSNLPTRSFEKWLLDRKLLNTQFNNGARSPLEYRTVATPGSLCTENRSRCH